MLGCGSMSAAWLENVRDHFSDRVEIVGFVDLNADNAARRAAEFGGLNARTSVSLDVALRELRPAVVFNCTVPEAHLATCRQALLAGSHVLVEKPLAMSVAESRELVHVAEQTGCRLAVIQNRRYLPGARTARRALSEGAIGALHTVCVDFFLAPHFGGFREAMQSPLLLDMAIHTFDQGRFLTGLNPRKAICHEFNPPGSWFSHGASATAIFEMAGGVVFNYRGSWCAQGFPTSWAGTWRIIGEKGTLLWDGEASVVAERIAGSWDGHAFFQPVEKVTIPPVSLTPAETGHAGNIAEFLDCLDSGAVPQTVAADNIRSIAMVEAAIFSARSGAFAAIADNPA
jgi:predicted dehydrogenase